jgi:hypothetical protein
VAVAVVSSGKRDELTVVTSLVEEYNCKAEEPVQIITQLSQSTTHAGRTTY